MNEKLTRWLPDSINPAREGVYEVRYGTYKNWSGPPRRFSYFDGAKWGMRNDSIESAYKDRAHKAFGPVEKWRGLARKP